MKQGNNSQLFAFLKMHGYMLGSIFLLGFGTFSYYLEIRPYATDDLLALSFGSLRTPSSFITGKWVEWLPAYRPLSQFSIWLQFQLVGIEPITYYIINLLLWIGCVVILYFIVFYLTKSRFSAFLVALLMMVDIRVDTALIWIIERQSPLTVLFGSSAILLFLHSASKNRVKPVSIWIFLLLVFSTLSKEYGLAYSGGLVVLSILLYRNHWKTVFFIVFLVAITYFGLRFGIAKTSVSLDFCEEQVGYRDQTVSVCYGDYDLGDRVKFYVWNIGSTFVGTFIPKVFSSVGQWDGFQIEMGINVVPDVPISIIDLLFMIITVGLVGVSLYKSPKQAVFFLSLILFNAILNYLLYRSRNHLVGLTGLYGLLGIGFYSLWRDYLQNKILKSFMPILVPIVLIIIGFKASGLSHYIEKMALSYSEIDNPCTEVFKHPYSQYFDMGVVQQLREKYEVDTECFDE